jgi:transposase InsO family protein
LTREGTCCDNAVAESFFATLKVELGKRFSSRAWAFDALFEYIKMFYNWARMHSSIGFSNPAGAEAKFENEAAPRDEPECGSCWVCGPRCCARPTAPTTMGYS